MLGGKLGIMVQLLPELFALIGINVFLVLSLLTYLLKSRFPKILPYVCNIAAIVGLGYLVIDKLLYVAYGEEYTRLWCSFAYLVVALTNVVAVNFYVAAVKRSWTIAGAWLGAVTLPSILISAFFISEYSLMQGGVFLPASQVGLLVLGSTLGMELIASLSLNRAKLLQRGKEVK